MRSRILPALIGGLVGFLLCALIVASVYAWGVKPAHQREIENLRTQNTTQINDLRAGHRELVENVRAFSPYCSVERDPYFGNAVGNRWVQLGGVKEQSVEGQGSYLVLYDGNVKQDSARNLTQPRPTAEADIEPQLSPDGRTVVFVRKHVDNTQTLWVVSDTGDNLRQLTTGFRVDSNPVWAPDGSIYYLNNGMIHRITLNGGNGQGQVAAPAGVKTIQFKWTAKNGTQLVAVTSDHIYLLDPNGSTVKDITPYCN